MNAEWLAEGHLGDLLIPNDDERARAAARNRNGLGGRCRRLPPAASLLDLLACLRRIRKSVLLTSMEVRISATELVRKLGDVLGRIRYRGEVFVVERNGEPVARITPLTQAAATLREGLRAWRSARDDVGEFANDLERVNRADRAAKNPWVS